MAVQLLNLPNVIQTLKINLHDNRSYRDLWHPASFLHQNRCRLLRRRLHPQPFHRLLLVVLSWDLEAAVLSFL